MESLAEEAELALSSWTCYIMELGGPYGAEMNFLLKKKTHHSVWQWKTLWNTVFHFPFAPVICPQMTCGISKFQPLFHNIRALHKTLGSTIYAWGLSYRFHNCAQELVLFGRESAHGTVKWSVDGDTNPVTGSKREGWHPEHLGPCHSAS